MWWNNEIESTCAADYSNERVFVCDQRKEIYRKSTAVAAPAATEAIEKQK